MVYLFCFEHHLFNCLISKLPSRAEATLCTHDLQISQLCEKTKFFFSIGHLEILDLIGQIVCSSNKVTDGDRLKTKTKL